MGFRSENTVTRRMAMAIGAGGLVSASSAALLRPASAAPRAQRAVQGGGGIAGGGIVTIAAGEAHFSLFASRFQLDGQEEPLIFGRFQWLDPAGTTLASTEVITYGPIDGGPENDRLLTGIATMNGAGAYPFTLTVLDAGGPGSGLDTLRLDVGPEGSAGTPIPAASPTAAYTAEGHVSAGDLQLLEFEFPEE